MPDAVLQCATLFTQGLFIGTFLLLGREFGSSQPAHAKQILLYSSQAGNLASLEVKQQCCASMQAMGQLKVRDKELPKTCQRTKAAS